jgi:hypothetical protein
LVNLNHCQIILLTIIDYNLILRLLRLAQSSTALLKQKFLILGPSEESRMRRSSVVVLMRFLLSVLILFIVEKPLSQSAVVTGRARTIAVSCDSIGQMLPKESLDNTQVITPSGEQSANLPTKTCLKVAHFSSTFSLSMERGNLLQYQLQHLRSC